MNHFIQKLFLVALFGLFNFLNPLYAQKSTNATIGNITFSCKTISDNGKFSPNHVLAIWITDLSGKYIRTLKVNGNGFFIYMNKWYTASLGDKINAITGSTLTSHQTHQVIWDTKDNNGEVVPDGTYKIHIQYADDDLFGPVASYVINKGQENWKLTPADQTFFKQVSIEYTVTGTTSIISFLDEDELMQLYPNPTKSNFTTLKINLDEKRRADIIIYQINGQIIKKMEGLELSSGNNNLLIESKDQNGKSLKQGVYIIKLNMKEGTYLKKWIITR